MPNNRINLIITNKSKLTLEFDDEMNNFYFYVYNKMGEKKLDNGRVVPTFSKRASEDQFESDRIGVKAEDREITTIIYCLDTILRVGKLPIRSEEELVDDNTKRESLAFVHNFNNNIKTYGIGMVHNQNFKVFSFFINDSETKKSYVVSLKLNVQNIPNLVDMKYKLETLYQQKILKNIEKKQLNNNNNN